MDQPGAPSSGGPPPPAPDLGATRAGGLRIFLAVVLVVIGVVALVSVFAGSRSEQRSDSFVDVTTIEFDLDNADIRLVEGATEVVVDREVSTGWLSGEASVEQEGQLLRVAFDCPPFGFGLFGFGCSGDYELSVPPGTGVVGTTGNGALRIGALDGPLDLSTSNGGVKLERTSGPVTVRTSNGAITATGLASSVVDLATSNGAVDLAFDAAPRTLAVRTSNGRIAVRLPADAPAYAVDATTSNGSVRNEVRTDPDVDRSITLSTSNGDIELQY